ncbi:hypothetical protein [Aurantimonas sp. 22II-16-19i]|uniref:hypothetical protein n=1 Tax=Aurantimonas sp. 22II-16-19i TaxID=1317114 RepID=UPI0009F7C547|nr:hypothetical protein [Aurantimonas sp. 22II-16-19i]ORE89765.1 hypothetical protein ATO4_23842 [Aurantimonas sp. 22II-16-19i]
MTTYPESVRAFVHAHMIARPGGRVHVGNAFESFDAFQRWRGGVALSRVSFGAALTRMAESVGGGRDGDAVTGLLWRENAALLISGGRVTSQKTGGTRARDNMGSS